MERFEDIIAWQKARELTRSTYEATHAVAFARDFGLCSQIQRAAVSVMANIAEGFERRSLGEFSQFLVIAKASCAELRSHLYVAHFDDLMSQAEEVARVLSGLRASVERQRNAQRSKS
jgi:four helix bundle protein